MRTILCCAIFTLLVGGGDRRAEIAGVPPPCKDKAFAESTYRSVDCPDGSTLEVEGPWAICRCPAPVVEEQTNE